MGYPLLKVSSWGRDQSIQHNNEWHWFITSKLCVCILSTALIIVFLLNDHTNASIEGSPHDVRVVKTGDSAEPCNTCHTPHVKRSQYPLWDSTRRGQTFELYYSSSSDMDQLQHPRSPSSLCLACHNGIFSKLVPYRGPASYETDHYDYVTNPVFWNMVDSYLNDEHPVGFRYDPTMDDCCGINNGFAATKSKETSIRRKTSISGPRGEMRYPLYGEKTSYEFECATCHAVHDTVSYNGKSMMGERSVGSQVYFLRHSNEKSSLCVDCHRNMYKQ